VRLWGAVFPVARPDGTAISISGGIPIWEAALLTVHQRLQQLKVRGFVFLFYFFFF
jgi:hypothetical protein